MWLYTADTVARITATRRPPVTPRTPRESSTSERAAALLRSIADRIDGPAVRTHTPAGQTPAGC